MYEIKFKLEEECYLYSSADVEIKDKIMPSKVWDDIKKEIVDGHNKTLIIQVNCNND